MGASLTSIKQDAARYVQSIPLPKEPIDDPSSAGGKAKLALEDLRSTLTSITRATKVDANLKKLGSKLERQAGNEQALVDLARRIQSLS